MLSGPVAGSSECVTVDDVFRCTGVLCIPESSRDTVRVGVDCRTGRAVSGVGDDDLKTIVRRDHTKLTRWVAHCIFLSAGRKSFLTENGRTHCYPDQLVIAIGPLGGATLR